VNSPTFAVVTVMLPAIEISYQATSTT